MDLPKRIIQHQHEAESYAILLYKLRKLGIFRNLTENDYGIDFEIELVEKDRVTGKYLKIQVKSADNIKIRKKDNIPTINGIKQSTLLYWAELSYSTNVMVFAVDINTEKIFVTRPIFWQAIKLLDNSDKSKTIEFLPIKENTDIISNFLTYIYTQTPTIRDIIHYHIDILRNLSKLFEFCIGVFHYDYDMSVNNPEQLEYLFKISKVFLWHKRISEKFPDEDSKYCYSISHWRKKSKCHELLNYICQIPVRIIIPELLNELSLLREKVLNSSYYWIHKNISYLSMVYLYNFPIEKDFKNLISELYDYEEKYKLKKWEADSYIINCIEKTKNKSE